MASLRVKLCLVNSISFVQHQEEEYHSDGMWALALGFRFKIIALPLISCGFSGIRHYLLVPVF